MAIFATIRFGATASNNTPRFGLGGDVTVWVDYRDTLTKALTAVSGVTFTVVKADGTVASSPSVTTIAPGTYRAVITPDQAGTWAVSVDSSTSGTQTRTRSFVMASDLPAPNFVGPTAVLQVAGQPGPSVSLDVANISGVTAAIDSGAPAAPFVRNTAITLPANTLGGQAAERVTYTQFKTSGRTDVEAINAAMAEIFTNNGNAGGEVIVPPGAAIACTAPITAYSGVRLRGARELTVPSWSLGTGVGLIDCDGVTDFAVDGFRINTGRRCNAVMVKGGATGVSISRFVMDDCRSIFALNGSQIRINDVIARNGTGLFGCGSNSSSDIADVTITNAQAYDMRNEAIDLNFNIRRFTLTGFVFRRCSSSQNGEVIDLGGGYHDDIAISDGVIDCGGVDAPFTVGGIKAKQGVRRLSIDGVKITNGKPLVSTSVGLALTEVYDVDITGVQIDDTFGRGLFIEPDARDVRWNGGSCNSIAVIYGQRCDLRFDHDGQGTSNASPAVNIGTAAANIAYSGRVRARPNAAAVDIGGGVGGATDCGVRNLVVEGCLRGVFLRTGSVRPFVEGATLRNVARIGITHEATVPDASIRNVVGIDCSTETALGSPLINVAADCHGSTYNDIRAIDTRSGAARTSGRAITWAGSNYGVQYDRVIGHNIAFASPVSGTSNLANSFAGSAVYIVTEPAADTDLVAAGYIDPNVSVSRGGGGLQLGTDGFFSLVASNLPRFTGATQDLLVELSQTPILAGRRSLTNAAWTATNATVAVSARGIDNVANRASRVTATAANATVTQAVTLTSASRTGGAYLRRVTGSGDVQITMDGGTSWTTVSITGTWARYTLTQTLANPTFGVRLVTSGDVIEVDYADIEARAFMTTPVPDGQSSRPAEAAIWTIPADWPAARTIYIEVSLPQVYSTQGIIGTDAAGSTANRIRLQTSGTTLQCVITSAGSNVSTLNLGTLSTGVSKVALAWDASGVSALLAGNTVQTFAGSPAAAQTRAFLGDATGSGAQSICGGVRRARALVTRVSDAALPAALAAW